MCGGIPGYWFYNEIKIDGKTVASGYSAISASEKVDKYESTVELLTSIYFRLNIDDTHIGCQIGSVCTKAIDFGDGWSHYFIHYNAPGNSGTDSGWVDP